MIEISGNIWDKHNTAGSPICVTTNGIIKSNGEAVMGRGIALEARIRFPSLPLMLATHLNINGNTPAYFREHNLFTVPTKNHWKDKASLALIVDSIMHLVGLNEILKFKRIYLPPLGCGYGQLEWKTVSRLISHHLDDTYFVVFKNGVPLD